MLIVSPFFTWPFRVCTYLRISNRHYVDRICNAASPGASKSKPIGSAFLDNRSFGVFFPLTSARLNCLGKSVCEVMRGWPQTIRDPLGMFSLKTKNVPLSPKNNISVKLAIVYVVFWVFLELFPRFHDHRNHRGSEASQIHYIRKNIYGSGQEIFHFLPFTSVLVSTKY